MGDIRQEGRSETQGSGTSPARVGTGAGDAEVHAPDWHGRKQTGTTEERRRDEPGESAPVKLLAA